VTKKEIEAIKLLASEYMRNHMCLEEPSAILGKVDYCVNEKVLFIKPQDENSYPYRNNFGYSHFCTCPIRMQIHLESKNGLN
jgi:hypothetical protein